MGTWGAGTFDDDSARDFLADYIAVWERVIEQTLAGDLQKAASYFGSDAVFGHESGFETVSAIVMPTVEVLLAVAEKLPCDYLPDAERISAWEAKVLKTLDDESAAFGMHPDDIAERRVVVVETFERLKELIAEQHAHHEAEDEPS